LLSNSELKALVHQQPSACAIINGIMSYPNLLGLANFYQTDVGVLVFVRVKGLPLNPQACGPSFFGMHIHEGSTCTGTGSDPLADTGLHYNPNDCPHPEHAGDLPPLIGRGGDSLILALTDHFSVEEIIGRTIVIHASPDDFKTQPAGNSGAKIACGEIVTGGCIANNLFFS
jgi:Cu-Zn family superoxide dismutase